MTGVLHTSVNTRRRLWWFRLFDREQGAPRREHGSPTVIDVAPYMKHITPSHLLGLAAAAETRLHHPVAEALRGRAKELGVNVPPCDKTQHRIGLGVAGQVNGYDLHVGDERFLRQRSMSTKPRLIAPPSMSAVIPVSIPLSTTLSPGLCPTPTRHARRAGR